MYNKTKDRIKGFIALAFMGLIVIQIAGRSVFLHAHILSDGTIISHTHPFDKSSDQLPFKTHHHRQCDYIVIEQSNGYYILNSFNETVNIIPVFFEWLNFSDYNNYHTLLANINNKAPPVLL